MKFFQIIENVDNFRCFKLQDNYKICKIIVYFILCIKWRRWTGLMERKLNSQAKQLKRFN